MKILTAGLVVLLVACGGGERVAQRDAGGNEPPAATESGESARVAGAASPASTAADTGKVTVLFFGTSITAGYGLDPGRAYPVAVETQAARAGVPIRAVNAGLSGETSAGAVRRIEWVLRNPVDIVIVETGGNDALRALDADSLAVNLRNIVRTVRRVRPEARVLLAVMEAPPNLGERYTSRFRDAYSRVAREEGLTLVPFLLDGVAGVPSLNQGDGIHPNEAGARAVAENVWRTLQPVVREVYRSRQNG